MPHFPSLELRHKKIFLIVNFAVLILIIIWLRENISLRLLIDQFKAVPPQGPIVVVILNIGVLAIYAARLSLLLMVQRLQALVIVIIGFGMNGILPFRLGELARIAYARQLFAIATPRLLTATAVEKLMDLCALLILGIFASQLVVVPYINKGIATSALFVGGLMFALVFAVLLLAHWKRLNKQIYKWILEALATLRVQCDRRRIFRLALLTFVIWVITVTSVYWMFALIFPQFSFPDACLLTLVLAFAIAVPSAPAGLGIVEAAIVAYLQQAIQAEANLALATALVFHLSIV
ncbi:MAG: flippase-like domain-containing protein, partial [Gammaproteobacteria bacterium]|nr:flippase-like domain-containing protein [Gammaproteobacteria bacterium]